MLRSPKVIFLNGKLKKMIENTSYRARGGPAEVLKLERALAQPNLYPQYGQKSASAGTSLPQPGHFFVAGWSLKPQ
jgi:hypothetical protein